MAGAEDVNYRETLIAVAEDCPVSSSVVPAPRGGKKTVPVLQYELLKDHPYRYTSAEVLFEVTMRHRGLSPAELRSRRTELWADFFARPQPCLRASALPKTYGWGIHCDHQGRVALCPMESADYRRFALGRTGGPVILRAFRTSRR